MVFTNKLVKLISQLKVEALSAYPNKEKGA